jgi:hypothetical protein
MPDNYLIANGETLFMRLERILDQSILYKPGISSAGLRWPKLAMNLK